MENAISQLTLSAIIVWGIETLKTASWFPVLTPDSTEKLKRLVGALAAGLAAIGVTYHYDPTLGVLTVSGLTLSSVGNFAWTWVQNFVVQQAVYHGVVKNGGAK